MFHRWVRDNRVQLHLGAQAGNLTFMTAEFPFFAKVYRRLLEASRSYKKGWEAAFFNAHNDFTWQSNVLLAPLIPTDDDDKVRRKIGATATYLDIWLMRRAVNYTRVGYSSVSYAMWLLCRDIRCKSLTKLLDILTEKLVADDMNFEGNESKGRRGIDDLRINQCSRRYVFHLLARLTAFNEVGAGKGEHFAQ